MEAQIYYVGMDLGTFKTSVASSSGAREVVYSAVGWPKDLVSRRMLGRDVVFGQDVLQKRLALNVIRPFEKGVLKYGAHGTDNAAAEQIAQHKEAARLLVDYAVALTRPPEGALVYGVIGAPSRATILNKQVLVEAAQDAFDAVMIVSEPFTVAYGMNQLDETLVIDIGAGTVDLCRLYGTFPSEDDQLTLATGGDFVDEEFGRLLREAHPQAQFSPNMAREIKEKYGFVHDVNEHALVTLPVDGRPHQFDVSQPLKQACKSIVPPIVDGLRQLIASFDPEFQRRLLCNILLGGGGGQLKGLDQLVEQALDEYGGGKVTRVPDPVFAGAVGALKLAMNMPLEYWDQVKAPAAAKSAA